MRSAHATRWLIFAALCLFTAINLTPILWAVRPKSRSCSTRVR